MMDGGGFEQVDIQDVQWVVNCHKEQLLNEELVQLGEHEVADSDDEYATVVRAVDTTRLREVLQTLWSGSGKFSFLFFFFPLLSVAIFRNITVVLNTDLT